MDENIDNILDNAVGAILVAETRENQNIEDTVTVNHKSLPKKKAGKDLSMKVDEEYKTKCKQGRWTYSKHNGEVFVSDYGYCYLLDKKPRVAKRTGNWRIKRDEWSNAEENTDQRSII